MSESKPTPELKRTLAAVLEKTTAAFAEHPGPDRLFAYNAGELSEEEEEALRDHLSLCRDCIDRLWLDPADPLARERRGVTDLETERAWRETAARIREIGATERLARERRRSRLYQIAAAACLVVAAGLGWRVGTTPPPETPAVSGPAVNVDIYDVMLSTQRSGSGEELGPPAQGGPQTTHLEIPKGFQTFALIFWLESGDYDAYELRILDSDRKEIWETRDVVVQDDRATLSLSRGDLSPGDYFVEIHCLRQGEAKIWEFPVSLAYQ